MDFSTIFKTKKEHKYLKLQFYIIENDNNGFLVDSTGSPLYRENEIGLPWIGTPEMLQLQLKFIKTIYAIKYGKEAKSVIPQRYEVNAYS